MKPPQTSLKQAANLSLTTHIVSERTAQLRFRELMEEQHALGDRRPKGRSLYQVVCRGNEWVGLILWTASCWFLKARDQWIGWDAMTRSERLGLVVQQARFLIIEKHREPNLASQILGAAVRDLPNQWEEVFEYRPLLAETFTDPESHNGTCYKAAGWEAVGMSGRDGRHYAEKLPEPLSSKKIWIKPLHPKAKELLCAKELPKSMEGGLAENIVTRSPFNAPQLYSLYQVFQKLPDPRGRQARKYPLGAVLTIVAIALLRGVVHVSAIVRVGQKLSQSQRGKLCLRCKPGTKFREVPGYSVYREVLRLIDLDILASALTQWLQTHAGGLPRTLAVDGKTIRDHLGLVVTLIDTEEGVPVAIAANPLGKGHEMKTTQALLSSPDVDLKNATVTADSLHTQDQTAHIITREKGGDYVLQLRDNQPTMHEFAQKQLEKAPPLFLQPMPDTDAPKSEL